MYYSTKSLWVFILLIQSVYCLSQVNIPPTIIATGNQPYCPLSTINIVTDFDIIDPDDTHIDAFYIQVSVGFFHFYDTLTLTGSHPNVTTNWDSDRGILTITGPAYGPVSYQDLIAAVKDVVFENSYNEPPLNIYFSFTTSNNISYSPLTNHYYEFVSDLGITWTEAKILAQTSSYLGLQGYLTTISSYDEAQLIGRQLSGTGWIGGSDAEIEGEWKWVTGPEIGTVFWNGLADGSSPNFAFWNGNEPNSQGTGNEDYAHISYPGIGFPGGWYDLDNVGEPSGPYQPKGYVVEYGGMNGDPIINPAAYTQLYVPIIDSTTSESRCGNGSVTLSAIASSGEVLWFQSDISETPIHIGETFTTPYLTETTAYYVLASENNCLKGYRKEVTATINQIPIIEPFYEYKNCDNDNISDGFTDFNLNEAVENITLGNANLSTTFHSTFFEAEEGINPINASPYNNSYGNTVYARIETNEGCFSIATIDFQVSTTSFNSDFIEVLETCDNDNSNDGMSSFNLTTATPNILAEFPSNQNLTVHYYRNFNDALLEQQEILPQNNYYGENFEILYVRVESSDNGDCFGIGPHLQLNVIPQPFFEIPKEALICLNSEPIRIEVNAQEDYFYEWKDENNNIISTEEYAIFSDGGIYSVYATSSIGCETPLKFIEVIESEQAIVLLEDFIIIDATNNNTITINNDANNLGVGDYEFSLNEEFGIYQDENYFENVPPGIHTFFIRDKNNCGITEINIPVIGFPKFFTPNNDGKNDYWNIKGIDDSFYTSTTITIFDRFGKVVSTFNHNSQGWDGTYNGKKVFETDYWFHVQLVDTNLNLREETGHFSLIRR
ncbi:T9SS type B sorting domain-containing protein [Urechidicola croceus]|uniref:C-type lectin domain-containing protein n=1 Tax=Urechidicola croceus TaxID=1850246 RepID=A0A1D8P8Y6_9FLAO|nr:T9SS type B sorting domain-containing protein [Urechidicola croceus]AOW20995.1 hypothetical protein LPB138_10035 [Urechidicola croceus]